MPMPKMANTIPKPVSVSETDGVFRLAEATRIYVQPGTAELLSLGRYLSARLAPATGYDIPVLETRGAPHPSEGIYLTIAGRDHVLGAEGYELVVGRDRITLEAQQPAGLMRGIQTIRQMLPASIESSTVQSGPWEMATGTITDYPRFAWRGTMLDVARHFFGVDDIKRTIDLMAYYKLNYLHLHLSDDQGWRIMIDSWPNLATCGGSTAVGGDTGGYYSQAEYLEIVAHAQSQYITVVPEIDMPGHTTAALASYGELNCDGAAPPLYTGTDVGFSSLCVKKEITYAFVRDVIKEIATLTPGQYFHIGGDEAASTDDSDYVRFIEQVQAIVQSLGKKMIGWEEIANAKLLNTSIAQYWKNSTLAQRAVQQGAKLIMSPASKAYLDIKYSPETPLGLNWAGYTSVQDAYTWDPATQVDEVSESDILGVEAPLWTETIETMDDIEFMAFPRLAGYAEIGWSPATGRSWDEYRTRLGAQATRLEAMGMNFFRSPLVPWQ